MALVLSRKAGESVRIDHDITVTIAEVRGGQVRVAIDAPRDTPVHREEIYLQIQAGEDTDACRSNN